MEGLVGRGNLKGICMVVELNVRCVVLSASVVHVLLECSTYSTCRHNFQEMLKHLLGESKGLYSTVEKIICAR